jgi:hypothetical protein
MQTGSKDELVDTNPSSDSGHSLNNKRDTPLVETEGDGWNETRIDIIGPNGNDGLHYEENK